MFSRFTKRSSVEGLGASATGSVVNRAGAGGRARLTIWGEVWDGKIGATAVLDGGAGRCKYGAVGRRVARVGGRADRVAQGACVVPGGTGNEWSMRAVQRTTPPAGERWDSAPMGAMTRGEGRALPLGAAPPLSSERCCSTGSSALHWRAVLCQRACAARSISGSRGRGAWRRGRCIRA